MTGATKGDLAQTFHDGPIQRLAVAMILLGKLPTRRSDGRHTKSGVILERIREELLAVATGMAQLEVQLRTENITKRGKDHYANDIHEPS